MTAVLATDEVVLHHGDCIDVMRAMPDASVDAIVTDPPYGLSDLPPRAFADVLAAWLAGDRAAAPTGAGFMGRSWDAFVPPPAVWDEAFRVLKPGGHLLAFAGSRTDDLMGLAIRLAGFEIRDGIAWLYGSGFPKSMDVATAIDKLDAASERRQRALQFTAWMRQHLTARQIDAITETAMGTHFVTDKEQPHIATAELFDRLRPHLPPVPEAIEQLVADRTVESRNWASRAVTGQHTQVAAAQQWRANYDGGRVAPPRERRDVAFTAEAREWEGWGTALKPAFEPIVVARKPFPGTVAANVIAHGTGALNIDANRVAHRDAADLAESMGKNQHAKYGTAPGGNNVYGDFSMVDSKDYDGTKGRFPSNALLDPSQARELDGMAREASRFFYTAKADSAERPVVNGIAHPTVKPLDLMRWLVRLVTPRGGVVLEPFAGSGTTLEAAVLEGFRAVGIEREADYIPLIQKRLDKPHAVGLDIFGGAA